MRAMLFEAPGRPLVAVDLPQPEPADGQALLRVLACGVCRTDLHLLDGEVDVPHPPRVLGHQIVGEVIEGNAQTPQGPGPLVKLAIVSAASGGVTVALAVAYPVQQGQNQGSNPDRPLDTFGDEILGTVRFPSDGAA